MDNFVVQKLLYDNSEVSEIYAGSIACSDKYLLAGTLDGYALFDYPSLTFRRLAEDDSPSINSVPGVALTDRYVILLATYRSQSFERPGNWDATLCVIDIDTENIVHRIPLGPGNWSVVRGGNSLQVVLYDTTENQGIRIVDLTTGAVDSHLEGTDFQRINYEPSASLLALSDNDVMQLDLTGHLRLRSPLPNFSEICWTAILSAKDGHFLLGGFVRATREYIFQIWDAQYNKIIATTTNPIEAHFPPDLIEEVLEFEVCCGADIFQVANLAWIEEYKLALVVLGGTGEYLGACQSACAVGVLDTETMTIQHSQILHIGAGATGLLQAPDGAFIVQCVDNIYLLR